MKHLADRGAGLAIGVALGLMLGAGLGNPGTGLALGIAIGVALEVDGRKRRRRGVTAVAAIGAVTLRPAADEVRHLLRGSIAPLTYGR
jgi:hypothetical protein